MRGRLLVLAASGLLLSACEPAPYVERPPPEFQDDVADVRIAFLSDVDHACRTPGAPAAEIYGCEFYGKIFVPNPCSAQGAYADLLCHELGHVNGWRHD